MQMGEGMKLGKKFGRIGFVVGFVGPVLFYSFGVSVACPQCPYIDAIFWKPMDWLALGLGLGLMQGLVFALLGFVIGYVISRIRRPRQISKLPVT
jgi:hypothetical protein